MIKLILILNLSLKVCLCANISPVALVDKTSDTSGNSSNKSIDLPYLVLNDTVSGSNSSDPKIVGGYDAILGEAPWQVGLHNYYGGSLFCGGTLLSPRVVVTAAHCMGRTFTVRLGGLDRSDQPLQYPVKEIFVHKDYNSRTTDNDIALVILDGIVNIPSLKHVEPARLPLIQDEEDDEYENQVVLISGWGSVKSGDSRLPTNLQAASVKIFSRNICKKSYRGYYYTDNMICAGVQDYTKDACQGDSGGPLVLKGSSSNSSNTLLGITSWGRGCAFHGYPGVYTKVANYVSWIEEKACSGNACLNSTVPYGRSIASTVTISGYLFICVVLSVMWK